MGVIESLGLGLETALQPENLLYVLVGVLLGMVVGVLPGLGPTATIAILLPFTYAMEPESAIIMIAGIYYGTMYGGTITSVLLNLPGEASSVVTTFDGYQMARQGRAGPALGIAAIGSFVGGMVAVVGMIGLAPVLARLAVGFGPAEFAALAVLGITMVCYLGTRSVVRSLFAAVVGLALATVGVDPVSGSPRFTYGSLNLLDGFDFVAIAMGLFGVSEILYNLQHKPPSLVGGRGRIAGIWPSRSDRKEARGAIVRGSLLGSAIGVLPGGGGMVSSLASYAMEKRRAKDPSRFGRGAIEGVAGPETANNASSVTSFIPLLTLGIPPNPVLALVFGALILQNVTPGPGLINERPEIFWGVVASIIIGNLILLLLNLPLVGVFIQLLRVRPVILGAFAVVVSMLGVFSLANSLFDMWLLLGAGVVGYFMKLLGFEPGPLVLAFVLGPILERSFRQSMLISGGDLSIFVTRPFSAALLILAVLLLVSAIIRPLRQRRLDRADKVAVNG